MPIDQMPEDMAPAAMFFRKSIAEVLFCSSTDFFSKAICSFNESIFSASIFFAFSKSVSIFVMSFFKASKSKLLLLLIVAEEFIIEPMKFAPLTGPLMMIFVVLFIYIRHLTIKVLPEKKKEAVKLQFAG